MSEPEAPIELGVERVRTGDVDTRVTAITLDTAAAAERDSVFVLVAGVGVAATYFEFLTPLLARHGTVHALDLPGFAGVPRPHEQPTIAFFADQVEAVIEHLGLADPVLIGHSMGTQVVTEVLVRHPEYSNAVLVSPVINEAERALGTQAVRFAQAASHESLHLALTAFSAYLLGGVVYFLTVLPFMMRYRISERVPLVRARLLFVRGEFDRTSPRRFHSRLVRAAQRPSRWEIEGAAHSIINGQAVGVAALTRRLLDDELPAKGRLTSAEAAVPEPTHDDPAMVLSALGSRAAEWLSALRGDDLGVAKAKRTHAKLLWRAFTGRD